MFIQVIHRTNMHALMMVMVNIVILAKQTKKKNHKDNQKGRDGRRVSLGYFCGV